MHFASRLEHVPKKLLDFFDIKTSDISDVS